ncbi:MAG: hypothetical protein K9M97_06745, partial [Akkermansiaceae bacterium]|nr:hypothetical protein [Akkermansiaceae bacterium]
DIHETDGNALVTRDRGFVRLMVASSCNPAGSWTLVQGWCREFIDGEHQSYGVNFSSMPVFTGIIDSATGSTITTTTSGKGQDLGVYLGYPAGATCFLELTDGPSEGHRFDLDAGGIDTFNLDLANTHNTTNVLPAGLAGSHFVVRRHDTLGGVYPNAEWDQAATPGSADQVLFYDGTGYTTYYNLSNGTWVRQGGGYSSRNGLVIAPGTGMLVVHADPDDSNEMLAIGDLRYHDFHRPVKLGTTGLNFTSLGYPFDASPASLVMTIPNGFVAAPSVGSATQILNWAGDMVVNAPGWTTNFLLPIGASGDWRTQGDIGNITTNAPLFRHCRSAHVAVQVDHLDWTHPRPWSPAPWVQPAALDPAP